MRVLHSPYHLRHQRHCSPRLVTQYRSRLQQTAPAGKLHAEKRQPIVAFAHFIDWQNVRMIEARRSLGFTPETRQRLLRIGVIRQNSFQCHDAARMPLPRPINHAHPTAPDFFNDLIVAYAPIGVTYIEFSKQVIKRFLFRRSFGGQIAFMPIDANACGEHAAKTKTSPNARCRSALWASKGLVWHPC